MQLHAVLRFESSYKSAAVWKRSIFIRSVWFVADKRSQSQIYYIRSHACNNSTVLRRTLVQLTR